MYSLFGKKVLITGVCGTIGTALIRTLLTGEYKGQVDVVGIDVNESEIFYMSNEFKGNNHCRIRFGDIRDRDILFRETNGVDIVIHTAALKHVSICETSPYEAVKTNLQGLQNVIDAALANNVEKVIFTSSDKAVNPSSNMGASKLLGEGLITAARGAVPKSQTVFASTRFGNVLGSRGSVVPIFRQQIANGKSVTLTDKKMTRFIMGTNDAVRLILDSVSLALGGEIFVTKMPVIRIQDLAEVMIHKLAAAHGHNHESIRIVETGIKPGEKLYEELMTEAESRRAIELEKYFVVLPSDDGTTQQRSNEYPGVISLETHGEYSSSTAPCLDQEELEQFLVTHNLLWNFDETGRMSGK